jgi:hypothetical protein
VVEGLAAELEEDDSISAVPNVRLRQVAETEVSMVEDIRLQERDELGAKDAATRDIDPK